MGRGRGRGAARRARRGRTAADADRYVLYEDAVQEPDFDVEFFDRVYRENYDRPPRLLREDFCGTAAISCAWVRQDRANRAIAVDLDPEPLAWCRANGAAGLEDDQRARIELAQADALAPREPKADVISCQNFSFFIYKTRDALRAYFRAARENLAPEGVLVMDMMGGSEVTEGDREEITEKDGYDYVWDQHRFDPVTADYECFIHFRFPDGTELERAFEYDWRLWTLPEVRELLVEAGFRRADVYWDISDDDDDDDDDDDGGSGEFERVESASDEPAWVAYVVAVK